MKTLNTILFVLITVFIVWHFATRKYISPYVQYLYLGKKGSGKSTNVAKLCIKYLKKGYYGRIYTNCEDINIDGVKIFNTYDLGKFSVTDSVIIIDEISVYFDNRDFKNTSKDFIKWLRYARHDRLIIHAFTQSYDCDKKIRTMSDNIYIVKKYFRVFSVARALSKNIEIRESALDAESQIVDGLQFVPIWIPNAISITYIPKYIKYFDSFKPLEEKLPLPYHENPNRIQAVRLHKKRKKRR